jgi:hypothetical protein
MNCERFQTVVSDLAHELLMEAHEQAAALQHAGECNECAARLADERSLTVGLRALANDMKDVSASPQLEAKMLAAFRERQAHKDVVIPIAVRSRRSWYQVGAIAATLLLAFGIYGLRGNLFRKQAPAPPSVINEVAAVPESTPKEVKTGGNDGQVTVPQRLVKRASFAGGQKPKGNLNPPANPNNTMASAANTQNAPPVEVTTDFYPIGYSNTPNLQEGGQLLRVELPRAAVARFGLPVNMDRVGQRVKADVLVGSDGLAQAIRFVQ